MSISERLWRPGEKYKKELAVATSKSDTDAVRKKAVVSSKELNKISFRLRS